MLTTCWLSLIVWGIILKDNPIWCIDTHERSMGSYTHSIVMWQMWLGISLSRFERQSDLWQNSSNSAQLLAHATVVMLKLKIHANMHSNVFAPLPTPGEMYMCTKCAWLNICACTVLFLKCKCRYLHTSGYGSYTYKDIALHPSGSQPHLIVLHRHLSAMSICELKSRDLNAIDLCSLYEWLAKLSNFFDVPFLDM